MLKLYKGISFLALSIFAFSNIVHAEKVTQKTIKLPMIEFPVMGGELPTDAVIKWDKSIESAGKDKADVFLLGKNSKNDLSKLSRVFDLEDPKFSTLEGRKRIENDIAEIELYDNGIFVYTRKDRDYSKEVDISDEEAEQIAKKFLNDNDLLPPDLEITGIGSLTKRNPLNDDALVAGKQVFLNRKINNKLVYGVSRIIVSIGPEKRIDAVFYSTRDIQSSSKYDLRPIAEALEDVKKFKGMVKAESDAKEIRIKLAELVYWEESTPYSKQTHIQPVYHFTGETQGESGTGEFEAFESAIPGAQTFEIPFNGKLQKSDKKPVSSFEAQRNFPKKPKIKQ